MAYIGNVPAEKYSALTQQTFSSPTGTSFTLDQACTNSKDIALFIDNVRQNPASYSVSGTSLTTSTISSPSTMYCLFNGKTTETVNPPDASVGASQLTTNAVGNSAMADDAVGLAELSATGTPSSSNFLRGDNSWQEAGGGSLTLIANTTLSSTSSVEYASLDGDTYYQYLLVATGVAYSTAASLYLRFGDSSTINTGASYYYFYEKLYGGGGTGYSASAGANTTFIRLTEEQSTGSTDGSYTLHGSWYISGLNTTINSSTAGRTACVQGTYTNRAGSGYLNGGNSFGSELAIATRAVNRFQIYPSSGNFHSGFFTLYGIAHA